MVHTRYDTFIFILFLPRQGTETIEIAIEIATFPIPIYFISSPSGDGNCSSCQCRSICFQSHLFYFFPVRGRKLLKGDYIRFAVYLFYFFPVRGRKLDFYIHSSHSIPFPTFILFLPRQGTET